MKFDTLEKDAVSVGDIKNNNVSIDSSNINFIVTILSTNLYSKPIQSFIRETVSNAWDSHVEAGITEPVILELGKDTEGNYFCRVQDFGVGLSPERFNSIYRNIGSSTKRGDDTQIGGFGIGRFSALAYSDVVHITSNYDAIQYKYIMYKDGNSISIDLLHQQPTDERNGLEVQVQLKSNYDEVNRFYDAIKGQLVYFENVYFIDSTNSGQIPHEEFNNFNIKKYKDFLVNDLDSTDRELDLVLGKVRYPLRIDSLSKKYPKYVEKYPVSLQFQIGELEVTPNREEILYNQKNIIKIETALDLAIEELDEIFDEHSNKDFTSLDEYLEALKHSHEAPLLTIDDVNKVYIKIDTNELKITFKGIKYKKEDFTKIYTQIIHVELIPINYELFSYKLAHNNRNISINKLKRNFSNIYIGDVASLNTMSKNYIRDKFELGSMFIHTKKGIKYFLKKYYSNVKAAEKSYYSSNTYKYDPKIVRAILKAILPNITKIQKFDDSKVPQSYIDQKKIDDKAKRALRKNAGINWNENINVFRLRPSERGNNPVSVTSTTYSLTELKKNYVKLTVFDDKDSLKIRALYNILYNKVVNMLEIAETRQKLVKDFDNFIKLKDFMSVDYKLIRQIGTARLILDTLPFINRLHDMSGSLGKISTKLKDVVEELSKYNKLYISDKSNQKLEKELIEEIYQLCKDKNYFDEDIRAVLNNNLTMLKNSEFLLLLTEEYNSIPNDIINLVVDYILARKLFRPDVLAAVKSKQETILNKKI